MADIGKTYALDATGDLVLQYGRLVPVTGTDKAVQDLTVLLRSIKGSALLSPEFGLDALAILDARGNATTIEGEVRQALEQYPYMKTVNSVTVTDLQDRRISISADVTLQDGRMVRLGVIL